MPAAIDIGTLIERSPEIRKGRPCIAGTGVTVRRIAGNARRLEATTLLPVAVARTRLTEVVGGFRPPPGY